MSDQEIYEVGSGEPITGITGVRRGQSRAALPLYDPIMPEALYARMRELTEDGIRVAQSKNHDYASFTVRTTGDALSNVGDGLGWVGAAIRANDKMQRIKTAYTTGKLKEESLDDAMRDLLNYAFYMIILWERRNFDVIARFEPVGDDD